MKTDTEQGPMDLPVMPATFTGHTPSGPTHCCVAHARQLDRLMQMMGAYVNFTKAPDGAECTNCKNEAASMHNAVVSRPKATNDK